MAITKAALRAYLRVYDDETRDCRASGRYWSLLHMLLAIPDICATAEKGEQDGDFYNEWTEKYLGDKAKEWWIIRGLLLHKGTTTRNSKLDYCFFRPSPDLAGKHRTRDGGSLFIGVDELATELWTGIDRWLEDVEKNQPHAALVEQRLKSLPWHLPAERAFIVSNAGSISTQPVIPSALTGGHASVQTFVPPQNPHRNS